MAVLLMATPDSPEAPALTAEPTKREELAFESATSVTKQVIALATTILAFTVTFSEDITTQATGMDKRWLFASWIFLGVSVIAGLVALMAIAGVFGRPKEPLDIYRPSIRTFAGGQLAAFAVAVVCFFAFAWFSLTNGDTAEAVTGTCTIEAPAYGECVVPAPPD